MSIKIEKFKNVYGINDLKGVREVNGNALIYAPNGGTKTSLALGFKHISTGIMPNDRIFENNAEYKFELDSKIYDNNLPTNIDNIVVYNFEEYYKNNLENNNTRLSLLTMSTTLNSRYGQLYNSCLSLIDELSIKISSVIGTKKKAEDNQKLVFEFFKNNFNLNSWKDIIIFLANLNWAEKIETEHKITNILNDNTIPIISDNNFINKVEKLNNTLNSKIESILFKGTFGSIEASKLIKEISNSGFFEAGHAIKLNGLENLITTNEEFQRIYDEQINVIYNSPEVKKEVEDLLSKINKNKATKEIRNFISNPNILTQLDNYNKFADKLIAGTLQNLESEIKQAKDTIIEAENFINQLMTEAKNEKTKWEEICEIFNERFDVPFKISVGNRFDSMIGKNYPSFEFKYIKNDVEKTISEDLLKKTLSTGEVRALTILYFLFDLNVSIVKNNETFVILDDVVDSFDYKNKYAMIEYISEMSKKRNIICWILTHNFDFFSSCKYRVQNYSKYFIKQNKDSENFQKFNESIIGGGMTLFSNWKESLLQNNDEKKFIALLPVCRNLIELKYDVNNVDYKKLCSALHLRNDTKNIKVSDIIPIYLDTFNINCQIDGSKNVYDILMEQLQILSRTNLTNSVALEDKILFSIGIRLNLETIFNKYDQTLVNSELSLGEELETIKSNLDIEDIKLISKAIISIPEFIHLNSFMYEPLVDISTNTLKKIYDDTIKLMSKHHV